MKKKLLNSMRVLLVAALLGGASSAWAGETTTLLEYGTASVAWTAEGLATWTSGVTATLATDNSYVQYTGSNNGDFSTSKTISPTDGTIINVEAVWRARSNTGRYWSNSCGIYFRFGNIVVAQNDQDKSHGYVFTGLSTMSSVTRFTAGSYRADIASLPWLKISMEINTATNTLTSFYVTSEDGATTYASASNVALTSADYTTVAFGFQRGSSHATEKQEQLKSIKITQTTQDVSYADYTVHFVDGDGAKVKEDVVRNGEVGTTVRANSDDKTTFFANDCKYVYKTDGDGVEVVAGGTAELTITYDKYGKYTATASAVSGGSTLAADIASVTTYVGESAYIQLNKYINVGGTWYSTANTYVDVTEADNNEVTYTAADIDYFYEFESLTGSRTDETSKTYSGGIRTRVGKGGSLTTPAISGGMYNLTVPYTNSNSSAGKLYLYTVLEDVETDTELTIDCPQGSGTLTKTITIPDGAALRFKNSSSDYNDNGRIDYITLKKLPTSIEVNMSDAGWATLYTPYALDFTTQPGITAYTAAVADGKVTLTKVDNVPANTGVVLKGDGPSYYQINVAASSETAKGDLLGSATDATAYNAIDGYTLYMLKKVGEKAQFVPVTAGSIAAGKAYLKIAAATARNLDVTFADEATGISAALMNKETMNNEVYNLKGQRVAAPMKGLYIVNGKKMVIK